MALPSTKPEAPEVFDHYEIRTISRRAIQKESGLMKQKEPEFRADSLSYERK